MCFSKGLILYHGKQCRSPHNDLTTCTSSLLCSKGLDVFLASTYIFDVCTQLGGEWAILSDAISDAFGSDKCETCQGSFEVWPVLSLRQVRCGRELGGLERL